MSKKNEFLYPAGFSDAALRFIDEQYLSFRNIGELPSVRNKHEAYGIMAEKSVIVASGASSVKRALSDALSALPDSNEGFVSTCEMAYNSCIETAMAAIDMAVAMQNVVAQIAIYAGQTAGVTPMEALASADAEEFSSLEETEDNE